RAPGSVAHSWTPRRGGHCACKMACMMYGNLRPLDWVVHVYWNELAPHWMHGAWRLWRTHGWLRWSAFVLAWVGSLLLTFGYFAWAWHAYDESKRSDGNWGHRSIDFGGQWLMGRMLVEGHGRQLYDRRVQSQILQRAYPRANQEPDRPSNDADDLMAWMMS